MLLMHNYSVRKAQTGESQVDTKALFTAHLLRGGSKADIRRSSIRSQAVDLFTFRHQWSHSIADGSGYVH